MKNTAKLTLMALSLSLAMILSYVEFLLPPIFSAVPGIKMGLANIAVIFLLYKLGAPKALAVSVMRVILSSLLFGTALTFAYSIAGALLSFAVMLVLKKTEIFSSIGVSICGAVSHNLGQIAVAIVVLRTTELFYYMAVLAVTGTISGIFVGIVSAMLVKKVKI